MKCAACHVRVLFMAGALAFVAIAAGSAQAENFPARPIDLILPYNPGGIVDFAGRVLAKKLSIILKQTVVTENKPGAGGIVGVDYVAHSAPDGYRIVLIDPSVVINQTLHKSMPYDVFKDLTPIAIVDHSPLVLLVAPQLGVKTYEQLVAYGNAHPGKLNFGSAGVGTLPDLAGEMWMQQTGIEATHVPYRGIGPSFIDLMSGKIQMEFSSIAGALPFTSKGKVIAVATTGGVRSPVYPNVPTMEQLGLHGFDLDLWLGVYGPAKIPPAVLTTLNSGINKALQDKEVDAAFAKFGLTPRLTSLPEATTFTKSEYEKWRKVITAAHISVQ